MAGFCFTDEVPGTGRKGTEALRKDQHGHQGCGRSALPLGEDLKVRDGLAGHSRLGSLCRGETEAGEDSSKVLSRR